MLEEGVEVLLIGEDIGGDLVFKVLNGGVLRADEGVGFEFVGADSEAVEDGHGEG